VVVQSRIRLPGNHDAARVMELIGLVAQRKRQMPMIEPPPHAKRELPVGSHDL